MHVRLLGRATTFADIALHTGAHDIFPRGRAALAARNDVVERQFTGRELIAAVLTAVVIAREQVASVELHLLSRQPIVNRQANNPRHGNIEAHRLNPVMFVGFEFARKLAEIAPLGKVVRDILTVIDVYDFGELFEKHAEGATDVNDPKREVIPVQNQNV